MRINVANTVIGVGAGVVDEVVERYDSNRGNTDAFSGLLGWSRVGVAALAYAGQLTNIQPQMCKTLGQSVTPLATKTLVKAIMQTTGFGSHAATTRKVNRVVSTNLGGGRVTWKPVPIN